MPKPEEIQKVIQEICSESGTWDAPQRILEEAARLILRARHRPAPAETPWKAEMNYSSAGDEEYWVVEDADGRNIGTFSVDQCIQIVDAVNACSGFDPRAMRELAELFRAANLTRKGELDESWEWYIKLWKVIPSIKAVPQPA